MAEIKKVIGIRTLWQTVGLIALTMAQTSSPRNRIGPTSAVETDTNNPQQISN
ncbi:hypothetical protein Mh1949_19340 [Mannheimia haemolytica]|nr:hypothetical protein F382_00280 [Mannheimia haemolytica D153]AGQ40051.1 hypothetical protein J451_00250 [Mannheimia haemolytica D174]AGR75233.1 hypothetical protein N220_07935 [Mannheimia haemolytica USMARC_2286]EPZ03107.1 hypothetical protein L279_06205 [Mannheimia haemolytica D38]EPZ24588.1 hypothetical protein L281_13945 [Mannheimia haemolytica MhSwine2000]EPZ27210.1 hypothetical protein L280_02355 [Mannheimia haemolytica MhBrain2012]EPZ30355.1 hypothetical protein L277_08140 [Mannheimi